MQSNYSTLSNFDLPASEVEIILCLVLIEFSKEINSTTSIENQVSETNINTNFGSDYALSLWSPILLSMMGNQIIVTMKMTMTAMGEERPSWIMYLSLLGGGEGAHLLQYNCFKA